MTEGHTARLEAALDGKYRIERKLGEGGMATVYLAEDLKHERRVALKILRPELAAVLGAERFLSEIKTTANLQHPHILPLFDSGAADGYLYYVMPFIDGETLREKLDREKQLGVDEAVRITKDVADALDYAHRNDVIHRDIKPANILLHDGRPVVADFGIALAVSAAGGGRMTETGLSLGTPHYMSPEQASADRDLSARSDVYSLGCVLYEMLAGQPPHTGPSAQSILVRILTDTPKPLTELRHTVPPNVASAVMRSIEKLPADRFDTAKEFIDALSDRAFVYAPPATAAPAPAAGPTATRTGSVLAGGPAGVVRRALPWALFAASIAVGAFGWLRGSVEPAAEPTVRLSLPLDQDIANWAVQQAEISADGSVFVIPSNGGLRVREAGQPGWRLLPGTRFADNPTLSPDGLWVAYEDTEGLFKMSVSGSSPITLVSDPGINAPHWGDDGTIVYNSSGQLWKVSDVGGDAAQVGAEPILAREPSMLPDGSGVIFHTPRLQLQVVDLETGTVTHLADEALDGTYVRTGHVLYGHPNGGLFALPFDLASHTPTGPAVPVLGEISVGGDAVWYSVSRDGTLVFGSGDFAPTQIQQLLLLGQDGALDTVRLVPRSFQQPRFSPDGRFLAYNSGGGRNADRQVFTYDLIVQGAANQLSFDRGHRAVWSPDGTEIVYSSERDGTDAEDLWVHPADGSGPPRRILSSPGDEHAEAWPSADRIVFSVITDLFTVDPTVEPGVSEPYANAEFVEAQIAISPSGEYAAYVSEETGQARIYVREFPEPRGKWLISSERGSAPRWSADGTALYYVAADGESIVRTRLDIGPPVVPLGTEEVWHVPRLGEWDLDPNGGRAVVTQAVGDVTDTSQAVNVIVNWFEELKRLTGGGG